MAIFTNVTVSNDTWYDINTLSGAAVGTGLTLQNISSGNVLLKESTSLPLDDNAPVLFNPSYGELSKASVDAGSLKMWAKVIGSPSKAIIAVYN